MLSIHYFFQSVSGRATVAWLALSVVSPVTCIDIHFTNGKNIQGNAE